MRRFVRNIVTTTVVVGGTVLLLDSLVRRATASWVAQEATRASHVAVAATRSALLDGWRRTDTVALHRILADLSEDEYTLGAAICTAAAGQLLSTERFPRELSCPTLADPAFTRRTTEGEYIAIVPVSDVSEHLGIIAIAHDRRVVALRIAQIRALALVGFGALGVLVLIVAAANRWQINQAWARDLQEVLGALTVRADRRVLLRSVRDLTTRLDQKREAANDDRLWTPARLRDLVREELGSARILILANREPIIHERSQGTVRILSPASGLVSALEPIVQACSGSWVAHGAGSADREFVDANDRLIVDQVGRPYTLRRVWLSPEEESGYYYGFANEGLWPLCHVAHARPSFRSADMEHYRRVNQRFVDAVCQEVDSDDPIILVQDYHFALAPRLLRERLPRATIVAFWHIPWPNAERFGICPWHQEILEGLLGASILGFHTQQHCNNFIDSVDSFVESRVDREHASVVRHGQHTLVRAYPISVEWPLHWVDASLTPASARRTILGQHRLPEDALIAIGVDRLDYTKGIEERFLAVERLLELDSSLHGRFTFLQLAAPTRDRIARYQEFADSVRVLARRINERFGSASYQPIILRYEHHDRATVAQHYLAADTCYVSSLHDGMNLVAKEFVATRQDELGVLLLSCFTGAARELTEAVIVNPYDIDSTAHALGASLRMSENEQRTRMRAMRATVKANNIYRWAGAMLGDAGQHRHRRHLGAWLERAADSRRA